MKKHKFTCIFIIAVVLVLGCGMALAAWNISEYAVNLLTMSSYKNSIQENYTRPDHVDPGQKVVKEVYIQNQGDVDSFVRVKIGQVFGGIDHTGQFAEDRELDPSMMVIHYNTDFWELCGDGYWYYKDVLLAGERTRKPLLDYYYLSEKADNRYKDKEARIIVNLESIQAEGGEMKAVWGKEEKDLGILYQPCTCETVTSVVFGKDHKLLIEGEKTDLFANFKNLQPGCSRSQTIGIVNNSDENIQMYLRAETINQGRYSQKKLELIQKLLTSYAQIEIRENNKVLYQGSVDGNLTKTGWSMKKDISLGSFAPSEGRNLVVKLSLSQDMDNEYEDLLAKVKWVFSAGGDGSGKDSSDDPAISQDPQKNKEPQPSGSFRDSMEEEENSNSGNNGGKNEKEAVNKENIYATASASPKTGDETNIVTKWLALFAAFISIIVIARRLYRKERN